MESSNIELEKPAIYVVGTPIGNLSDFTLRGQQVLKSVDFILAEDTRKSALLLQRYKVKNQMFSYHDFSDATRVEEILRTIFEKPAAVALVTDSGTPLISDPGFTIVKKGSQKGVPVIPIPGPSALIACLSVSDVPIDRFIFEGFLPSKDSARVSHLRTLMHESRSMVFYEAPHRIVKFLESVGNIMGVDRRVLVAREMTKLYETMYRGSLSEVLTTISKNPLAKKGEFTIVVEGRAQDSNELEKEIDSFLSILLEKVDVKTSVQLVSKITKAKRNIVYKRALMLKKLL